MQPEIFNWVMSATGKLQEASKRVEHLELTHVYVVPTSRNRGIGSALVQAYLERARSLGLPAFLLAEPQALSVYRKLGFKERGCVDIDLAKYGPENCGFGVFRLTEMGFEFGG